MASRHQVRMASREQVVAPAHVWTPRDTLTRDMLAMLDAANADNADVTFEVTSNDGKELFHAHGLILAARCPTLANLAEGCNSNTPIPIVNVQADVFKMLLRYVYGGEIPRTHIIKDRAIDIIHAADLFACINLKIAVEIELCDFISMENAADLILFAHGHTLPQLMESTIEFFAENKEAVMASEGFKRVAESPEIMLELLRKL